MRPVVALIIANVIWGAAPPVFKFAYENIPPFTLGMVRFTVATIMLLPFLARVPSVKVTARQWATLLLGAAFIALHLGLFFVGLQHTASINTSIISAIGPILLYFASVRFLHEGKNGRILIGMVIALAGSLIVIVSPLLLRQNGVGLGQFGGNILILLSTITDMVSILLLKKSLKTLSPLFVTIVMFAVSALVFYPFALIEMQNWSFTQLDHRGIIGIIFGALLSSTLAYYLHDYGIAKIKAEEVGVFSYIGPVVTVLVAIPLLGELPTVHYYAGAVLVILGILIAERKLHWHTMHELKRQK